MGRRLHGLFGVTCLAVGVGSGWAIWSEPPKTVRITHTIHEVTRVVESNSDTLAVSSKVAPSPPHVMYLDAHAGSYPRAGGVLTLVAGLRSTAGTECIFHSATFGYHTFNCSHANVAEWQQKVPPNDRTIERHWKWTIEAKNSRGWSNVVAVTVNQAPAVPVG